MMPIAIISPAIESPLKRPNRSSITTPSIWTPRPSTGKNAPPVSAAPTWAVFWSSCHSPPFTHSRRPGVPGWDDANRDHIARHRVAPEEAEQVIDNDPLDLDAETVDGEERTPSIGVQIDRKSTRLNS